MAGPASTSGAPRGPILAPDCGGSRVDGPWGHTYICGGRPQAGRPRMIWDHDRDIMKHQTIHTALETPAVQALSERSRAIFRHIVDAYVSTGAPIGSRTISRKMGMSLSPATVRNVMADLEDLGLLYAPHASAGRLPWSNVCFASTAWGLGKAS